MKNTEHKQITPAVGTVLKQPTRMYLGPTRDFPIVGIGASAGGLEAMELFLKTCRNIRGISLFNISILLMWNFTGTIATQYCYGVLQVLIDLKYYLIIST
jgi:hypothetical protein